MITLEETKEIISSAEQKAHEMGLAMNIAVMDAGRNLVAFHRMDGAWVAPPHRAGVNVGCESIQRGRRRSMLMVSASGIAIEL